MGENHRKNGGVSTKLLLSQLPFFFTNFQTWYLIKAQTILVILLFGKQII